MPRRQPVRVSSFATRIFATPLKRPFVTSLGYKTSTTNVGFTLALSDKSEGYGEASASLALAHLSPESLAKNLSLLGRRAVGQEAADFNRMIREAWALFPNASPAAAAFECALLNAALSSRGTTVFQWLGGKLQEIESDITISAWSERESFEAAQEAAAQGFRFLKIKIGANTEENIRRIRTVHRAAPKARLRLDGNQAMTASGSLRLLDACLREKMPVELLEQPLPRKDYRGMAELSRRSPIPIAADESVSTPDEAVRAALEGCAHVFNIKVAKSGISRSLEIAAVARAAGLDLMIGCMCETARGLFPSLELARGTGFFRYADLDSARLLETHGADASGGPYLQDCAGAQM
ncbi:MAG: enolase C-terminal domain-like protein [Elusimicrobiota bacterium]